MENVGQIQIQIKVHDHHCIAVTLSTANIILAHKLYTIGNYGYSKLQRGFCADCAPP